MGTRPVFGLEAGRAQPSTSPWESSMTQPPPYDPNQPPPAYPQQQPYPPQGYPPPPYPPQQAPYGYQPGPPPKPVNPKLAFWTSGPGIVLMFVIAGVAVLALVGIINRVEGPASAKFDTAVTSCKASGKTATVGFTIKNTSSSTRNATVKIEYRDGSGNRIDTDTAYVRDIRPGDTVSREESTFLDAEPTSAGTCHIVGIR